MADTRDAKVIKYLNLGYRDFVKDIRDFSKIFFPETSKDLSDFSSGQMMIEQGAFIGDILSFYLEDRFKNSNLVTANDIRSIFTQARSRGYPLQGPYSATGETNFYIEVPAKTGSTGGFIPNLDYAPNFKNVKLQNSNGIQFEALDDINFKEVNISSSQESRVSRRNDDGTPSHFILKYKEQITAGKTITQTTTINSYKAFREVEISEPNVLEIISVTDSEGNEWYEVDYLAQEVVFEGIKNTNSDSDDVPYNLKIKTVPRRFVKVLNPQTGRTTLRFGSGKATEVGSSFVPDPADIALDLRGKLTFSPPSIDPQNFLRTRTLGLSPFNTTLTIKARVGGGKVTNTSQRSLKDIISRELDLNTDSLDTTELNNSLKSFSTENDVRILGGDEASTPEEIKQYAMSWFAAQNRVNTREDYIVRTLSLPSKFGRVFRAYATYNCNENGGVQIYVIAKDNNNQLIVPPNSLKANLKRYLSLFTRLNQGIDILDGRIINIGIEYTIVAEPGQNKTQVKIDTLKKVKEFFDINKWQLNQPIVVDDLVVLIKDVPGVLTVSDLKIINKNNTVNGNQYSTEVFSIKNNTRNGIVFAPENGIFEVKYKNRQDIKVGAL